MTPKTGIERLTWRHPLLKAFVIISVMLGFGTTGYMVIEKWSLLDALCMTVTTLTTIGYGEIHPLSSAGRTFTLVLIIFGIGWFTYAVLTGTRLLIEGEVANLLTRRRSMKAIDKLRNHFVICGFGRMGAFVCQELELRGIHFVVVENNPEVQDKIIQAGYFMVPGDATEEDVLLSAGIRHARGLVSVLNSDAENVYVVLTARELRSDLEIVARAGEEVSKKKLYRAGANRVVSPYQIGGKRMVFGILKPTVLNFLELVMDYKQLNVELEEVRVTPGSVYAGKRLMETDIRRELNLIIIAIKKPDGEMVFNPGPDTVVDGGDILIAMGTTERLAVFEREASAKTG